MRNKKKEKNKSPLHNGIILSHFNQSSSIFISPGQGLQCVANCIMSIIYHKHKDCIHWKLIDIKNILYSGNILYNSIGKFTTILVSDLPKHIKLYNTIYNIQEVNSMIGNIFLDNKNFNTFSFAKAEKLIVKYKYMILILGSSALSIIYSQNNFYTFDPHRRNTHGLPDSSGGAAVLKFNSFNQLCLYIYELSHYLHTTDYELTPIIVKKYSFIDYNTNKTEKLPAKENINKHNSENTYKITAETEKTKPNKEISLDSKFLQNQKDTNTSTQIDETHSPKTTQENEILQNSNSNNETQNRKNLSKNFKNIHNLEEEQIQIILTNSNQKDISCTSNILDNNDKKQSPQKNDIYSECVETKYDNIKKRKLKNTETVQRKNENIKRRKLTNTTNCKETTQNTNKRKLNTEHMTKNTIKKIKNEEENTKNYQNPRTQQSIEKLIPTSDMIILKNEKRNKQTYKKIRNDYKICTKYGYKFNKICTVHMTDITQTLAILNAKIKMQTKKNTEILLKKQSPYKIISRNNNITQFTKTKILKKCTQLIKKNKLCEKYGYKFKKILIVQIHNNVQKHFSQHNTLQSLTKNDKKQYGKTFNETIEIFNKLTSQGPIYVCSVCQQNNFEDKVHIITNLKCSKYTNLLNACKTNYTSINNKEYICTTCKNYITKGIIPKLSIKNGCGFPNRPIELDLFNLEERFISPVMAFMLIHQLFPGRQLSLYGSICHLPIEIGKMVHTLPRNLNEFETISVKLKRRLCYKNTVFNENVRPQKIIQALKYLLQKSELYKQHNININTEWLTNFENINNNTIPKNPQSISHEKSTGKNTNDIQESSDDDISDEEPPNAPSINTLLTEKNIDPNKNVLCIAPAEGQKPIFTDADTEYLCFPTIFCGQRRKLNEYHNLSKREIFKYEMRCADKRVSTNIPNIFWKTKYKQIHQIHQQVSFALRRNQTKGKKITAKTLLNPQKKQEIVKYDDGYKIFKNVRSSPPYFESKKKELMAMIRQLGIPTLFISLSAADTKWPQLLQSIYLLTKKTQITIEQLEQMPWTEKCDLISKDPGTCALYFNNRVKNFFKHILKSPHSPLGKLENFFYRVEFQHRGSPHIHALLWIKNAPHYEKDNDSEIIEYVDRIISCSSNDTHKKYIDLQVHKHSKTCIKKTRNRKQCRFGAPWPPLDATQILYPLETEQLKDKEIYSKIYTDINKFIQLKYKEKNYLEFDEILTKLNINYEKYILALRSTINKKKIFLKRKLNEIYINNYMFHLIDVWKANHDIQYVLDPYSCVVYICDYLMKNNKSMSKLLESASKEAKMGNMDLKQSVRHIGNKFLNCSEMSEQECAYSLLELPMTQSSIKVEFINTSEIHNRVFIAKPDHILKKMNPNSEKIKQMNNIDRYAIRPNILKQMCLADFISLTHTTYTAYKTQLSDDEQSVAESSSDDENNPTTETSQTDISHLFPIKLRNKIIKLRRHRKVIRFVNYKYKVDPENYCREKLLLYIPWQHDELKILKKHKTYIDAYNYYQKDIQIKMKIFEPAARTIENAMIEYEEHPEKFAPNSNSIIENNSNIIPPELEIIDTQYNFLIPEDQTTENTYDLQEDLKIQKFNYIDSIQTKPNILDNTDLTKLINSLNLKQYKFYQYIIQKELQNENEQTLVCLHGGAGTGKSYTLKAIYQTLNKILNNKPGQKTNDLTTLLIAPTGKAAHNIKGHTIHAAFHIPANQSLANYTQLSWDNINSYRSKYINLKWIICDEISMVSNYMLKFIHLRLQEIKCNNLLFGGINIITVGDLHQLKPVMGQFVFEDYRNDYGPLATNLWTQNFKIYELTDIMRQKDDKQFAQLLNRLRIGTHTKNDIRLLKKTKTTNKHLKNKKCIPHFYPTLEQVRLHNEKITKNNNQFSITSKCTDILPASISQLLETNIHAAISKRKITHTGGLPEEVILISDEQYDLISNIDVEDGLINGAQCLIKYIETTTKNETSYPYIVWTEFENTDIGKNHRKKYSYLYTNNKNRNWTPIIRIKRTFLVKDHWIHRLQFPLRQAAARSIHVSQSSTYPEIYVDLDSFSTPPKVFWEHMHYVAFSRVTSISGLYIENINENNIAVSKKVSDYLKSALKDDTLQTDIEFSNKYKLNILFNNCRSFKKHFTAIQHNKIILQQDINIFLESRLCRHDNSTNYNIDDNIIIRADQKNSTNPYYGIISYVKNNIKINKIEYLSTETIDTLYLNITFKNKNISIFAIYNSPKNTYNQFEKHITSVIEKKITLCRNIILLGDFNLQYNSTNYLKLCNQVSKYNLKQHITKFTTINNSTIDFVFTNIQLESIDNFYAHWSDHHMIQFKVHTSEK